MGLTLNGQALEYLYAKYNRRKFVHPDPLEFLYAYPDPLDREIVGLIASCLAYGRVRQILNSVSWVLERLPNPSRDIRTASRDSLMRTFADFRHRFTTGEDLVNLLLGMQSTLRRHESLRNCFEHYRRKDDETILPALSSFVDELSLACESRCNSLLPSPQKGSACKRLHLFLRWMARKDAVDPGGWDNVPISKLIVPLDTHMHRISRMLRLTERAQPDIRTAIEITGAFRAIAPADPVRYDFALTRLGIRSDGDLKGFLEQCAA